jgi:hypothetical protein
MHPADPDQPASRRAREAVIAARGMVRAAPGDPEMHFLLARVLTTARQFGDARIAVENGLALAPDSTIGLLTLADLERSVGHRDAAHRSARAALVQDPSDPYGRWLMAMLDAERLNVRRSLRTLQGIRSPDLTWPVRGLLSALGGWLGPAALLVLVAALAALRWQPVALPARILGALFAAVVAGFTLRVLVPAGRVPWRALRLLPRSRRRAVRSAVVTAAVMVALLLGYAVTGAWWLLLPSIAGAPAQWWLRRRAAPA